MHYETPSSCHVCIHGSYGLNYHILQIVCHLQDHQGNCRKTNCCHFFHYPPPIFYCSTHTHVKYFVLHLIMWRHIVIWCLHACGLLLLHEYFQWFINWFDCVVSPQGLTTVCVSLCYCLFSFLHSMPSYLVMN